MSAATYEIDGRSYSAAEILDDSDLRERWTAIGHAERYPDGCREVGHRCEACTTRLGETAHEIASRRRGARPGYRGWIEYRCLEPGCKADV